MKKILILILVIIVMLMSCGCSIKESKTYAIIKLPTGEIVEDYCVNYFTINGTIHVEFEDSEYVTSVTNVIIIEEKNL